MTVRYATSPTVKRNPDPLTQRQQNAYQFLVQQFSQPGLDLGSLAPTILKFIQQGYNASTIKLMVADTPEYKQRFAGNEARVKAGLNALSVPEYLAQENSYRELLRQYGLPKGFYDSRDQLAKWIGNDVSPSELNQRLSIKKAELDNGDQYTKDALRNLYGFSEGDMLAHLLDPQAAAPVLERQARAVQFGAAQLRAGLQSADAARAEQMGNLQFSDAQLREGLSAVAQGLPTAQKLANIDHTDFTQANFEDAALAADPTQQTKVKKLASNERARFSQSGGLSSSSLNVNEQGSY